MSQLTELCSSHHQTVCPLMSDLGAAEVKVCDVSQERRVNKRLQLLRHEIRDPHSP